MNDEIQSHRPLLFSLAYHVLGDTYEAEDIVQDTFVTWFSGQKHVTYLKAYLSKIVINKSIDRLSVLKKQREQYKGTWLPVPFVEAEENNENPLVDHLPYAILCTLETLNPIERAVFILHEAFNYSYSDITEICNITEENARQILHRSREKLDHPRIRFETSREKQKQLLKAFLKACEEEDMDGLTSLLKNDVILFSDGGGKVSASLLPIYGSDKIIKFVTGILAKVNGNFDIKIVSVNGVPGALFIDKISGKTDTIFTLNADAERISELFLIRNPDKIFS
jgi:RNA polymerase sigma-70 factor (ECF subfamily)